MRSDNKKIDKDADFKSMKEITRILKKNGNVFLTLPFGRGNKSWYRKYDMIRLKKLLKGFKILETIILKQTHIGWEKTNAKTAMKVGDSIYYKDLPGAVIFVKAKKLG